MSVNRTIKPKVPFCSLHSDSGLIKGAKIACALGIIAGFGTLFAGAVIAGLAGGLLLPFYAVYIGGGIIALSVTSVITFFAIRILLSCCKPTRVSPLPPRSDDPEQLLKESENIGEDNRRRAQGESYVAEDSEYLETESESDVEEYLEHLEIGYESDDVGDRLLAQEESDVAEVPEQLLKEPESIVAAKTTNVTAPPTRSEVPNNVVAKPSKVPPTEVEVHIEPPKGEITVANNGSCLFESVIHHLKQGDYNQTDIQKEREATVKWMKENLENKKFQGFLLASMLEHYERAKIKPLRDEKAALVNMRGLNTGQSRIANDRLSVIDEEIKKLEDIPGRLNMMISCELFAFESIEFIRDDYFEDMKKQITHGGNAELYALSIRHNVCILVHEKRGTEISPNASITMNDGCKTKCHLTHTHNHYNPYYPDSSES